jgi:hypothetical protein
LQKIDNTVFDHFLELWTTMTNRDISPIPGGPICYRPKSAAKAANTSLAYIYTLMASGELPFRKAGKVTLNLADDLRQFIESLPKGKLGPEPAAVEVMRQRRAKARAEAAAVEADASSTTRRRRRAKSVPPAAA